MAKKDQTKIEQISAETAETPEVPETAAPASKGRLIKMEDGREINFGVRGLIKTDIAIAGEGADKKATLTFDLYSGKTYKMELGLDFGLLMDLAAYGAKQKVGDSIVVTDNPDDANSAVERVISQLQNGIWVQRQAASQEARGFTDFWHACLEFRGIPKADETGAYTQAALDYKAFLQSKDDDSIKAMRAVPQIRAIVSRYAAERAAAKAAEASGVDVSNLF